MSDRTDGDRLLRAGEVAEWFGCDPHTVTKWSRRGRPPYILTPLGHRRYQESVVKELARIRVDEPQEDTQ